MYKQSIYISKNWIEIIQKIIYYFIHHSKFTYVCKSFYSISRIIRNRIKYFKSKICRNNKTKAQRSCNLSQVYVCIVYYIKLCQLYFLYNKSYCCANHKIWNFISQRAIKGNWNKRTWSAYFCLNVIFSKGNNQNWVTEIRNKFIIIQI